MHTASSASPDRPRGPVTASPAFALACGAAIYLAARISLSLPRDPSGLATIWLGNAVAVTGLVSAPRRAWPGIVLACLLGNLGASLSAFRPIEAAVLTLCNGLEYVLAASLLRRLLGRDVRILNARQLAVMAAVSGAVCLTSGVAAGAGLWAVEARPPAATLKVWLFAHVLSLLLLTPCFLIVARRRERCADGAPGLRSAGALALVLACDALVFGQSRAPVLFLVPPVLMLLAVEAGALGAAGGVLATAVVAMPATALGRGPVSLVHGSLERNAVLMLFLVVCLATALPVASLQRRQRRSQEAALGEAERARAAEQAIAASQARLQLLADQISDVITVCDMEGRFTFVSPSVTAMTGYAPEELIGCKALSLVHPDDLESLRAAFAELGAGRLNAGVPLQYRMRRKDGAHIWLDSKPHPVMAADGQVREFVDVARDVTFRVKLAEQMEAARQDAETAARIKAEFLANMSHELRTPLTAVLGFTGLIADQPELSEATRGYVRRVRTAGKSLLATVNDVLDFSKLEAGQIDLAPQPTAPAELVREVADLLRPEAEAKGLALEVAVADATPGWVVVDPDRLRQVTLNLVANAVKFTDAGRVDLGVDYKDGRLLVSVADTGPGIALAEQGALFQRFSQVDGSSTRRHGGTGLGLAICRGLVEAMGGSIGVDSAPGRGARFAFALPTPASAPMEAASPLPAPTLPAGLRLLVVDDHPVNRELARLTLQPQGVSVTLAADGEAAVETAGAQPFDVIFMDLRMPGMDGESAARWIRENPGPNRFTPILAFTASPGAADEALFDGTVVKPLSPQALLRALAEAVAETPAFGSDAPALSVG